MAGSPLTPLTSAERDGEPNPVGKEAASQASTPPPSQLSVVLRSQRKYVLTDVEIDKDFFLDDEKRTSVIVGPNWQAEIPDFIATPFNAPEKTKPNFGTLQFSGREDESAQIDLYLQRVRHVTRESYSDNVLDVALNVYEEAGHDPEKAFQMFCAVPRTAYTMKSWTAAEKATFETLLKKHGKNFSLFREPLSKTTKEIIQFYYLWKKTQEHDIYLRDKFRDMESRASRTSHQFLQVRASQRKAPTKETSSPAATPAAEKPAAKQPEVAHLDLTSRTVDDTECASCGIKDSKRWRKGPRKQILCNSCYVKWLRSGRQNILPCEIPGYKKKINVSRRQENSIHSSPGVQNLAEKIATIDGRRSISNEPPEQTQLQPVVETKRKADAPWSQFESLRKEVIPGVILFNTGLLSTPYISLQKRPRVDGPPENLESTRLYPVFGSSGSSSQSPVRLSSDEMLALFHGKRSPHGRKNNTPKRFKPLVDEFGLRK